MAYLYILFSKSINKYYIGSCKDLDIRLEQHKNKDFEKGFTRISRDWELYYSVSDLNYQQARKIEKHIKNMKSIKYIQNLSKYPEIIEKLKHKYSNS